jgi:hypothetical protein
MILGKFLVEQPVAGFLQAVGDGTVPEPPYSPRSAGPFHSPPPEQAKNVADNSRATKGGQMIRYRHAVQSPFTANRQLAILGPVPGQSTPSQQRLSHTNLGAAISPLRMSWDGFWEECEA